MGTSPRLESKHDFVVHRDELFKGEKKKLPFLIVGSLLFVGGGIWTIITGHQIGGWGVTLFSSLMLLTSLVLLSWEPLLVINEQEIRIRSHPLLTCITLQWNEITAITPSIIKDDPYISFTLSLPHFETFLHHQSLLSRKFLERKLNRLHPVVLLRTDQLPCSVDMLFASIQEYYPTQIQQYSIQFGDTTVFDESWE